MKFKKSLQRRILSCFLCAVLVISTFTIQAFACTSVLVGKNASKDGSVIIARNEDYSTAWAKHLVVHPRTENPNGAVFKSNANNYTFELPQTSFKYTATPDWDGSEGQMEEAGINEYGVGVSATETTYASEAALKADPFNKDKGITEAAIPSVLLPSVKTARQGVALMGNIVESVGAGESFGFAIADPEEAWYFEAGSGHHWAAVRVPDDSYMVAANQLRIKNVDLNDTQNYLGSKDLISFAIEKSLYDPKSGEFSFCKAYGRDNNQDLMSNHPRVWWGEKLLTPSVVQNSGGKDYPLFMKPDKKIALGDVMSVLRSHYEGTPYDPYNSNRKPEEAYRGIAVPTTMESHVIQLRSNLPAPIGCVQWVAMGQTDMSVYVPFYSGINDTPAAYKQGTDTQDDSSAYWTYRTLESLTSTNYDKYSKIIIPEFNKFEQDAFSEQDMIDKAAVELYKQSPDACSKFLTNYSNDMAQSALQKAKSFISKIITDIAKTLKPFYSNSQTTQK